MSVRLAPPIIASSSSLRASFSRLAALSLASSSCLIASIWRRRVSASALAASSLPPSVRWSIVTSCQHNWDITTSSAAAEIARVGGRCDVQGHSRSLMLVYRTRVRMQGRNQRGTRVHVPPSPQVNFCHGPVVVLWGFHILPRTSLGSSIPRSPGLPPP